MQIKCTAPSWLDWFFGWNDNCFIGFYERRYSLIWTYAFGVWNPSTNRKIPSNQKSAHGKSLAVQDKLFHQVESNKLSDLMRKTSLASTVPNREEKKKAIFVAIRTYLIFKFAFLMRTANAKTQMMSDIFNVTLTKSIALNSHFYGIFFFLCGSLCS